MAIRDKDVAIVSDSIREGLKKEGKRRDKIKHRPYPLGLDQDTPCCSKNESHSSLTLASGVPKARRTEISLTQQEQLKELEKIKRNLSDLFIVIIHSLLDRVSSVGDNQN